MLAAISLWKASRRSLVLSPVVFLRRDAPAGGDEVASDPASAAAATGCSAPTMTRLAVPDAVSRATAGACRLMVDVMLSWTAGSLSRAVSWEKFDGRTLRHTSRRSRS